jgi:hypothetical protein
MTNKKFLFIGMAVLLSASLFFLGCGGDEEEVGTPAPSAAETLVDDLGGAAKAEASGTTVTLKDNVELAKNVTVPDGVTLTIGAGYTLTVPADKTLTVTGTLNGVGPTSKLVLGAAVTVAGTELAAGTYVWDSAWFDETAYNAANALVATGGALVGKATSSGTTVTLTDNVTIAASSTTTVAVGVTLVVPSTKTLTVSGILAVSGTVTVESGGTLVGPGLTEQGLPVEGNVITFTGTGKVELEQGATGYYGETLFVSSSTSDGYYQWDSTASSSKVTLKGGYVTEVTAGKVIARANTGIAGSTFIVVADGATLTIADSVVYTVAGTLTVKDGGTLIVPALTQQGTPDSGHVAYAGSGIVELEQGAAGYYGASHLFISDSANAGDYQWDSTATNSKVTLKTDYVTELTAGKVIARANTGVAGSTTITIAQNATLTVADSITFTVGGTLTVNGTIAGTGTNSALVNGGTISFGTNGTKNFYPQNNNTAQDTPASSGATYKWATDAGGGSNAGWKAQS